MFQGYALAVYGSKPTGETSTIVEGSDKSSIRVAQSTTRTFEEPRPAIIVEFLAILKMN